MADGPDFRIIAEKRGLWAEMSVPIDSPVWVAPLAEAFHRQDCPLCGDPRSPLSRATAIERDLAPCPICEP